MPGKLYRPIWESRESREDLEREGKGGAGLGGGTSCQMKAGMTFAGTNAETKVNIKRCHLISRGVPGDESSTAKDESRGEDNSPGVNNTKTRHIITLENDEKNMS